MLFLKTYTERVPTSQNCKLTIDEVHLNGRIIELRNAK